MVNGVQGSLKYTDSEWCSWLKNDTVSFTVDLKKQETIHKLILGSITNHGMAVHKPANIAVWVSADNRNFRKVGEQKFTREEIFREGTYREDISFVIEANTRFVRVVSIGAGNCPKSHVHPGQEARIYFDEVVIE